MGEVRTVDGRYWAIEQGDTNFVVYDTHLGVAAFDRWSWEAQHGHPTTPDTPGRPPPGPGPIHTEKPIRVTDERDGTLLNRGYAYWSQSVAMGPHLVCFAGHTDGHPRFFQVDLPGETVTRLGSPIPYAGTGEGWYFDREGWVYLTDGPRLRRVHPFTGEDHIVFDIEGSHPGCMLWQAHSSEDGQTHSATVKQVVQEGAYPPIGTVVFRRSRQTFFDAQGALDESIITADGRFLIIQENNNNRIINLDTRETRLISDGGRAVAHCDCGPSYVVGEADKPDPGACVLWFLDRLNEGPRMLFPTTNMGHVSVKGGRCLLSDHTSLSLVALDGSGLTHLRNHGMVGSGYDYQCHANLSPCGRVAAYLSNAAGRFDMYLLVLQ